MPVICICCILQFYICVWGKQVFEQVGTTDQMCKVLLAIVMDMENLMAKEIGDIETHAIRLLGDLKALTLFYVPTCQQKGPCRNPLPAPAPSVPYLQKTLKKFQSYLSSVSQKKVDTNQQQPSNPEGKPSSDDSDSIPNKKRKLEAKSENPSESSSEQQKEECDMTQEDKAQSSGLSASSSPSPTVQASSSSENLLSSDAETQRNFIAQDLITILLGSIETLSRAIVSANQGPSIDSDEDEEAEIDDGEEGPIIDVDGVSGGGLPMVTSDTGSSSAKFSEEEDCTALKGVDDEANKNPANLEISDQHSDGKVMKEPKEKNSSDVSGTNSDAIPSSKSNE